MKVSLARVVQTLDTAIPWAIHKIEISIYSLDSITPQTQVFKVPIVSQMCLFFYLYNCL